MPPQLIISAGQAVGFTSAQVFARPVQPLELSSRSMPRGKTVVKLVQRLITRSTPIALRRSQYVVLHKPNT